MTFMVNKLYEYLCKFLLSREVGGRKLVVGTRLVKELEEFSGELSLEGLHFWKTVFSAMTHPVTTSTPSSQSHGATASEARKDKASAGDKKIILLPCKNPPSQERVQLWLEARKQYESLQNGRQEKNDIWPYVEGNLEKNVVKTELGERLSSIRRRKKHNLSLIISPMKNTGSHCNSTEVSAVSDKGRVDIRNKSRGKDDDDDNLGTPLESPELPTWQQSGPYSPSGLKLLSENMTMSLSPSNFQEKAKEDLNPSGVSHKEVEKGSPLLAHSTHFIRRRRRSKEDVEPLCSTPISEGKKL